MTNETELLSIIENKIKRDAIYLCVAFADMTVGIAMPYDNELTLRLGLFMLTTGFVFGVLITLDVIYSSRHYFDWHTVQREAYKAKHGIRENEPTEPPLQMTGAKFIHELRLTTQDKNIEQQEVIQWKPGDEPSRLFIEKLFVLALSNENRHVPERIIRTWQIENIEKYDSWLDLMERVRILEKVDGRPHAARRWKVERYGIEDALKAFGYGPLPPTDLPPTDGGFTPIVGT